MKGFRWISWGVEDVRKPEIPMIDIVLPEFSIALDDLGPDKENLDLIPPIALSCFTIHGQVKQVSLKIPKDNDESTKSTSIHDEMVYKLIFPHRLMQRYLIKSLL